nr:hypothetical protein [Lachnospiraceae bacterium]
MKRFFKVTALALVAAFMIESDAQAAFAAGAPEAEEVFETSDYTWTGDEGEGDSISTESAEELESRYTVSGTDARKPFGVGPISPTQVDVKEDGGVISVTNKAGFDIYAAPVEQSLVSGTQKGIAWVNGYKVKNGE